MDLDRARDILAHPIVVVGRNVFDPAEVRRKGFIYFGTGQASDRGMR
jgi:hypothetical protein